MFVLFCLWLILGSISWIIGTGVLQRTHAVSIARFGDRTILALWLGITLLGISLLATSLLLPLSPLVGGVVALLLILAALQNKNTRQELYKLPTHLSLKRILIYSIIGVIIALFNAQPVTAYDTGLYHFPVIQWLSEHGTVFGLALLSYTFGYPSSWLALATPFNLPTIGTHLAATTGGFALILCLAQGIIALERIWRKNHQFVDYFLLISTLICLPIYIWFSLPISPSPDVPLLGLSILVPWLILLLSQAPKPPQKTVIDASLIVLILAAAGLTIKLTGMVLFLTSFVFYLFFNTFSLKRLFTGIITSLILLFPMFSYGLITSGCPLYPAPLFCVNVFPWSVGTETARQSAKVIQNCARWLCPPDQPPDAEPWDWVIPWLIDQRQATFLILCSLVFLYLLYRLWQQDKIFINGQKYIISLGSLGTLYMLYGSPSLRIGLGYLFIIPAFSLALAFEHRKPVKAFSFLIIVLTTNLWLGVSSTLVLVFVSTLILTLVAYVFSPKISDKFYWIMFLILVSIVQIRMIPTYFAGFNWILPPPLPTLPSEQLITETVNDVEYTTMNPNYLWEREIGFWSTPDQCWATPLPCSPFLTHDDIRLRDPEQGIRGGFIRNEQI
ncbi:LIC_10190 family membrane protein [Spirulina subsalsa]|uniref:LIC_10190 family membrane protein n=1 Tax=Spirulina subsalsa TaxID=54311 RepID=UPI0002E36F2B|nr:hypothetical protein [Spirulina subsalsa]